MHARAQFQQGQEMWHCRRQRSSRKPCARRCIIYKGSAEPFPRNALAQTQPYWTTLIVGFTLKIGIKWNRLHGDPRFFLSRCISKNHPAQETLKPVTCSAWPAHRTSPAESASGYSTDKALYFHAWVLRGWRERCITIPCQDPSMHMCR